MTQDTHNPVNLDSLLPLLPAEDEFAQLLGKGGEPEIRDGKPPDFPVYDQNGHPNVVRAEIIRFFAYGGNDAYPVSGSAIYLQGAWIYGKEPLNLSHADIRYALGFFQCHFVDRVEMINLQCPALYMLGSHLAGGLQAGGLRAKGPVYLRKGFAADKEVDFSRAQIGGDLDCTGGKFNNPSGRALTANQVTIKGGMFLHNGFSAEGEVRLLSAHIDGDFDCKGGKFSNFGGNALSADGMTVGGNVFLNNGFSTEGQVKLPQARIGRDLNCASGKFRNPKGYALSAFGATVGGNMFLCEDFVAEGRVNILGANIGGNLDCAGGGFYNIGDYALNAERVITGGHVFLNQHEPISDNRPFFACGRVRFANADIGRNFNCKGGQFFQPGEKSAIAAAGLRTRGAVFLSEGFAVRGNVDLNIAQIGGSFVCKKCAPAKSIIDLSSTKVVAVDDDSDSWEPFEFLLDNFTYNTFYGVYPKNKHRSEWLKKRPKTIPSKDGGEEKISFSPLPYEQAANILFDMGHGNDAREILLEKERGITEHGQWRRWQKPLRWCWEKLAGYGYKPARTFVAGMIVIAVGGGIFWFADENKRIVPHQPIVLAKDEYRVARKTDAHPAESAQLAVSDYPGFNPLLFSADIFVPLFNLHQEPYWAPDSGDGNFFSWIWRGLQGDAHPQSKRFDWWWFLTLWYWVEIILGWILTSLFLLSVTGLLRPRQSSSRKD